MVNVIKEKGESEYKVSDMWIGKKTADKQENIFKYEEYFNQF